MENDAPPTPTEVEKAIFSWLRHWWDAPHEKSKSADWAMVVLTFFVAIAGFWSAFIFRDQLRDTHESFRINERAWVGLEPIKPTLWSNDPKMGDTYTCDLYPKNYGKTVARDIVVKAEGGIFTDESFGSDAAALSMAQDKGLLGKFHDNRTNNPIVVPNSPVPKVLPPNSVSPAPFRLTCQSPQIFPGGHQFNHYLVGRIDYCDEFNVKHWHKFCFYVANARGDIWPCKEGNDEDRNEESESQDTSCRAE